MRRNKTHLSKYLNLTYLFALLALISLLAGELVAAEKTTIRGKIENPVDDYVTIHYFKNYIDRILLDQSADTVKLNADNSFVYTKELKHPIEFTLKNGIRWTLSNKFLKPGDELKLDITFSGKNETELDINTDWTNDNKFLNDFIKRFYVDVNTDEYERAFSEPVDSFLVFINNRKKEQLDFLNENADDYGISELFKKYIKAEINYNWALDRSRYVTFSKGRNVDIVVNSAGEKYFDYIDELELSDPISPSNMSFPVILIEYLNALYTYRKADTSVKLPVKDPALIKLDIAKEKLNGEALEVGAAFILVQHVRAIKKIGPEVRDRFNLIKESFSAADQILDEFEKITDNKTYLNKIKSFYQKEKEFAEGMPAPDFTVTSIDGKTYSLKDFRGKVVYMNFWSRTSVPCMKEIPYTKKLIEKYGDRDIIFLFISMDDEKEKLREYLENREFTGGIHITAEEGLNSEIAQKYRIDGIPHYIVINKTGRLISADAERPSGEIEFKLRSLIY